MADESAHAGPAGPGSHTGHPQPDGQPAHGEPPPGQQYDQPPPGQPPYGQPYGPPGWQQPPGYPPPGYPLPGYALAQPTQQTEALAIVSLILAVAGTVMVPVLAHIAALILAPMAKKNIRASGGRLTGEGLALAAQVVSWIVIAGAALLVAAWVAFLVWAASLDPTY
jgi:hypothetical protein